MADLRRRQWRVVNGERQVQCSSCQSFLPATKEHFYFNPRGPHSWCKPCYLSNSGRGFGMGKTRELPPVPEGLATTQAKFVASSTINATALVGASLGLRCEREVAHG